MGKYHPHGDAAIYDALVRMAQPFSMSLPLIDGQGNFGSVDGDRAAAMRYTESRLARPSLALIEDINSDTVDFQPNYDGKEREPTVLPARFPNLLVNGAGGIAVGMATNIPPHNLGEVIDACVALIDNPEITLAGDDGDRAGPGFPHRRLIMGRAGIRQAYETSRGSVLMRGVADDRADPQGSRSHHLHRNSLSGEQGDADREDRRTRAREEDRRHFRSARRIRPRRHAHRHRDQARRGGGRRAQPALPLHRAAKLVRRQHDRAERRPPRKPEPACDCLRAFIDFREEVVSRRTKFMLNKARDGAHIQVGLAIAVANIDEVIRLIRTSADAAEARAALMARLWPARDMAPLVALIADLRHGSTRTAIAACRRRRPAPSSNCACNASPRSAATKSRKTSTASPPRSPNTSKSCARAKDCSASSRTR